MHPFYGPSDRLLAGRGSQATGLVSMFAYLAFWAAVVAMGRKILDQRFPVGGALGTPPDSATAILRERYARGELDRAQFLQMRGDLREDSPQVSEPEELP